MRGGGMRSKIPMELYLHDRPARFEFVVQGDLMGEGVESLQQSWITAKSILKGRETWVDVTELREWDEAGEGLLRQMKESGVHLGAIAGAAIWTRLGFAGIAVEAWPESESGRSGGIWLVDWFRGWALSGRAT